MTTGPAAAPELGIALPNAGPDADLGRALSQAELAVELGFASVWATDHLLVGDEAAGEYGAVVEPLTLLAAVAARLPGVALGTSILLLPLRDPVLVAKQAAVVQELSGGTFRLGVGVGWHEAEFHNLGLGFTDRGSRADEAIALLRALWSGADSFHGEHWSFTEAFFGPRPAVAPPIWVGGRSPAARRRARRLGDGWHPVNPEPEDVASRTADGLPVLPRVLLAFHDAGGPTRSGPPDVLAGYLRALLESGTPGAVISVDPGEEPWEHAARRLAREVLPEATRP